MAALQRTGVFSFPQVTSKDSREYSASEDSVVSVVFPSEKKKKKEARIPPFSQNVYDLEPQHCLIVHIFFAAVLSWMIAIGITIHATVLLILKYVWMEILTDALSVISLCLYFISGISLIITAGLSTMAHSFHENTIPLISLIAVALTSFSLSTMIGSIACNILSITSIKRAGERQIKELFENYGQSISAETAWNNIQTTLKCCGLKKPDDWSDRNYTLPASCCKLYNGNKCEEWYTKGCSKKFVNRLLRHNDFLLGFGCIALPLIIAILIIMIVTYILSSREQQKLKSKLKCSLTKIRKVHSSDAKLKGESKIYA